MRLTLIVLGLILGLSTVACTYDDTDLRLRLEKSQSDLTETRQELSALRTELADVLALGDDLIYCVDDTNLVLYALIEGQDWEAANQLYWTSTACVNLWERADSMRNGSGPASEKQK